MANRTALPTAAGPILVEAEGLRVAFDGTVVLDDVTLQLREGRLVAVVGPNGAGKTTLAKALLNLVPFEGRLTIAGETVKSGGRPPQGVGYVPQYFARDRFFPLSVEEFLYFATGPLLPWVLRRGKRWQRVQAVVDRTGIHELLRKPVGVLSGGELQRVLLTQALLDNPRFLVLDEPSTGLDVEARQRFYETVQAVARSAGLLVVLISHELDALAQYADEVLCVNHTLRAHGDISLLRDEGTLLETFGFSAAGSPTTG